MSNERESDKWKTKRRKLLKAVRIDNVGTIFELAFDGQLWTECYWKSELEITEEVTA
jgi:hypothetical protein